MESNQKTTGNNNGSLTKSKQTTNEGSTKKATVCNIAANSASSTEIIERVMDSGRNSMMMRLNSRGSIVGEKTKTPEATKKHDQQRSKTRSIHINKVVHRGYDSILSSSSREFSPTEFDLVERLKVVTLTKTPTMSNNSGTISISGSSETTSASYLLASREIKRDVQKPERRLPIRRGYSDDVHNMIKKRGNRLFKTQSHNSPRSSSSSDYGHVYLNIYDLEAVNRVVNVVAGTFGAGAYHAGVEIYGCEYNFGYTPQGVSGIVQSQPRYHAAHKYRRSIDLGKTMYTPKEVMEIVEMMKPLWLGTSYDILKKNCLNFADAFCKQLGVGAIPTWVMGLQNKINWTRDSLQSGAAKLKQFDEAVGISRAFGSLSRKLTGECTGENK
uniref:PPPDE domain-containing protein n=1 Tax=Babesia bovis TaxID=5865 RepID=S6B773_BABBO|nr:conserved hypothetical protein [Babesia bovis]